MTLTEVLISTALTLAISAAAFTMVAPVHGLVQAQPEAADMHQRLRVAVDTLTAAIVEAQEVTPFGAAGISIEGATGTRTYYLAPDGTGGTLRRATDGASLPVVDHVTHLAFEFFERAGGEVHRVRVTIAVQAAPPSLRQRLPAQEVQFDVALRHR
jgi:hypothetical protein